MPQEQLSKQTLYAKVNGKKPVGRPRARLLDYNKDHDWNCLVLHLSEGQFVLVVQKVWWLNLVLLFPATLKKSG